MSPIKHHQWNPKINRRSNRRDVNSKRLIERVLSGDVNALSQAITLIESTLPADQRTALEIMEEIVPETGQAYRIAITGSPGVGKSTFLEQIGQHITAAGHRIAILSIDPSSSLTHGSILGDKTRMSGLSKNPNAYIRPTPAGHHLGGIGFKTKETLLLCEAAGFDTIFIETVGVGQSETEVYNMSDVFILLIEPGAGDELQGIKRGIMELADLILITKADAHPDLTNRSLSSYRHAVHILTAKAHGYPVNVLPHDSIVDLYTSNTWLSIKALYDHLHASTYLQERRQEQNFRWLDKLVNNRITQLALNKNNVHKYIDELKTKIKCKDLSVPKAAQLISSKILDNLIDE